MRFIITSIFLFFIISFGNAQMKINCDSLFQNFYVSYSANLCVGSNQNFTADNIPLATYQWSDSSGVISTSYNFNLITQHTGVFEVYLAVNSQGCTKKDTISYTVLPYPETVLDLGNDQTFCEGQSVVLNATVSGASSYSWSTNATTPTLTVTTQGQYYIRVTNQCGIGRDTVYITVKPKPKVDLGGNRVVCSGTPVTLEVLTTNATFLWSTGETTSSISVTGRNVTVWVNVDSNQCIGGDTITISDCPVEPQLPNAFSPNGDGKNDVLYVRGNNISEVELFIYNRLGVMVFQSTSQSNGWDGSYKGSMQEPDTYVYILKAKMLDGTTFEKAGTVALLR